MNLLEWLGHRRCIFGTVELIRAYCVRIVHSAILV
jgi:hypothetical protein